MLKYHIFDENYAVEYTIWLEGGELLITVENGSSILSELELNPSEACALRAIITQFCEELDPDDVGE